MNGWDVAWAVAATFLAYQAATVLVNLVTFPRLRAPAAGTRPNVRTSMLIPVRDEIDVLPRTLPSWTSQGADEVIVLDDGSRDGSSALLARMAARTPGLRVVTGKPLPRGWTGKSWACHQLAQEAKGDLLVFSDADVAWSPGALASLEALWSRDRPGLLSVFPRQRTGSLLERIVVTQIDLLLLGGLPYPLLRLGRSPAFAVANGQCMTWTREAYRRTGGHRAVRAEVLEDVHLAKRATAAGVRLALALGGDMMSVRMYRSTEHLRDGFAKNVHALAGSWPRLIFVLVLGHLAYTVPWPLALMEIRWLWLGLAGVLLRAVVAGATDRTPAEAPLQALAPPFEAWIVWRAWQWRDRYAWKGRTYAREEAPDQEA